MERGHRLGTTRGRHMRMGAGPKAGMDSEAPHPPNGAPPGTPRLPSQLPSAPHAPLWFVGTVIHRHAHYGFIRLDTLDLPDVFMLVRHPHRGSPPACHHTPPRVGTQVSYEMVKVVPHLGWPMAEGLALVDAGSAPRGRVSAVLPGPGVWRARGPLDDLVRRRGMARRRLALAPLLLSGNMAPALATGTR